MHGVMVTWVMVRERPRSCLASTLAHQERERGHRRQAACAEPHFVRSRTYALPPARRPALVTLRQRLFPADSQAKNSTLDEATDIAALEHSDSLEVLPPPLHRCRTTPCPTQKLGQRYVLSPPSHLERG